jgi:hypothetical protein
MEFSPGKRSKGILKYFGQGMKSLIPADLTDNNENQ